ncbi:MAG: hypothetical protein Q9170_002482 [Blastenia crenularia]
MPVHLPNTDSQLLQSPIFAIQGLTATRYITASRKSSSDASMQSKRLEIFPDRADPKATAALALARLPTSSIFRSLFLGAFFSSPILSTPVLALMKKVASSPSRILNPEKNPVLRAIVKPLVDSEQQIVQTTIDRWTINMMPRYNQNGIAVVYNTIQAYLKTSRQKLEYQLQTAHQKGRIPAIKPVGEAYIENDIRELIHDTKSLNDESYNGIVRDVLSGNVKGVPQNDFPKMELFLSGHNPTQPTCRKLAT